MLTYGLGRGIEYSDKCTVQDIAKTVEQNDYRFSEFDPGRGPQRRVSETTRTKGPNHESIVANFATHGVAWTGHRRWRFRCWMPWAPPLHRPPVRTNPLRCAWPSSMCPTASTCPIGRPQALGEDFELPYILEPLARVKSQMTVLSGLAQDHGRPHGDGPGDHARALASFLTGQQARKTHGADIKVGVSVDQVAARKVGAADHPSRRSNWVAIAELRPATATAAIAARTRPISPGAPTRRRRPRRSIPSWSSSGCSTAAPRPRIDRSDSAIAKSVLDFVLEDAHDLQAGWASRIAQARRVSDLGPRAGVANFRRGQPTPDDRCPITPGPPAFRRTMPSTFA